MKSESNETGIQVIHRAADILRSCRDRGGGSSLGAIAADVNLPRSTVQRIVAALLQEGLLQTSGRAGSIKLGQEIYALADSQPIDVVESAQPLLKRLSEVTGETVDLAKLNRDHLVFINQIAGRHRLSAVSAVGESFPLHCTANGKAILALMSDREFNIAQRQLLRPMTPATITSKAKLRTELRRISKTGIAIDREEHTPGICAVGVAFRGPTDAIYAISIPMPAIRFPENLARFSDHLTTTKQKLLAALAQVG